MNLQVAILRRMLTWAQSEGLIVRNPLEKWQPVRDPGTNRRRALTPEELPRLLDAAPPWRRILWATMAATGMRKGEATQILTSDFDPAAGVIRLRPEITKSSRARTCPLPSGLTRLLTDYMIEQEAKRPRLQREYLARIRSDLSMLERAGDGDGARAASLRRLEAVVRESMGHKCLFANAKGLPIRRNLDREFRLDLARAGIDRTGVCIHSLRYTANSAMLAAGVNETIIRARMGHVSARMTARYHDRSYDDRSGTKAIADLIGVADHAEAEVISAMGSVSRPRLDLATEEVLRPPPEVMAALAGKFSNVLIGR